MRDFLIKKFGIEYGEHLYSLQQKRLRQLLANTTGKTKAQMKTLKNIIMPRIALYLVLMDEMPKDQAYGNIQEYLVTVVCAKMKKQYLLLEKIPFFAALFKKIFIIMVLKSDNWEAECVQSNRKDFQINIHKCLWYDACAENGCPELTRVFWECDDINYGGLNKISFSRSGSIGFGNSICDFHFKSNK